MACLLSKMIPAGFLPPMKNAGCSQEDERVILGHDLYIVKPGPGQPGISRACREVGGRVPADFHRMQPPGKVPKDSEERALI